MSFYPVFRPVLAVPPPHFRLLAYLRRCLARSELPLRTHSSRSFFRGFLRPRLPFWTSSGLWAVLSFDSNRLSFSRSSHCACGFSSSCEAYSKSATRVTFDSQCESHTLGHPVLSPSERIGCHFLQLPSYRQ